MSLKRLSRLPPPSSRPVWPFWQLCGKGGAGWGNPDPRELVEPGEVKEARSTLFAISPTEG